MGDQEEIGGDWPPETHSPKPPIGIHDDGEFFNPITTNRKILNLQANKWRIEWYTKRTQGIVGRASGALTKYTAFFSASPHLEAETKVTFIRLSTLSQYSKVDRKIWGFIEDAKCSMCGLADESIKHVLTDCAALKHLYISRHNAVLNAILSYLVSLENLNLLYGDVIWDTVEVINHNKPDLVLITPSDTASLPKPFNKTLIPSCITILDVAITWDDNMIPRRDFKIERYTPLFKKLGLGRKNTEKLLKDINLIIASESVKIWKHATIQRSFV